MNYRCFLSLLFGVLVVAPLPAQAFDDDIAPLIVRRCLDCHNDNLSKGKLNLSRSKSATTGGKSGAAVKPGSLKESLLWQRVEADEMPPKKPLSDSEKALLKRWIEGGARWGTDPIDPFRVTTDKRAGYDWWALKPIVRPEPPKVKNDPWPVNAIDAFVLDKLQASKQTPSPAAERRTLIRRLSFDLLGLPPTPQEVEAFVNDKRPDAYEKLVDKLLASPHYGERWARHWLDVVRFGESDGFERDLPRLNAWPYRDWVIDALNRDMPYDEFVRLQLAGDVLKPGDVSALQATGFLVAGPHDIVFPVSESMKATMQQDEMEDLLGAVGQTFLGLTVNCARCHDHKFDPISQHDYYRLIASLAGVRHGERTVNSAEGQKELVRKQQQLDKLIKELNDLEEPIRKAILAERKKQTDGPKPIAEWDFTQSLNDRIGTLHGTEKGTAKRDETGLRVDGKTGYVETAKLGVELREKTLEAWVKLDNLTQQGGGVLSVQTSDGNVFDAIVFGEQQAGYWMAGSDGFRRTQSANGIAETERGFVHIAITYKGDGTITLYRNGQPYGKGYRKDGPITYKTGTSQVLFGLRHGPPGGNKMLAGTIQRARLYDRALTAEEVAQSAGTHVSEAEIVAKLKDDQRDKRKQLLSDIQTTQAELQKIQVGSGGKLYAVNSANPGKTFVLRRGSVDSPAEEVQAGGIKGIAALAFDFKVKADAPEGERRAALAKWITDPANPLTARVMMNRLWHHHFGVGLVETPNDFGFNGGRPSHPQLLDWLAAEFREKQYSLKAMHKLIVMSATYRQSSAPRADLKRIDADNRLLWRYSPQRLDAESLRDAMLATSGVLDRTIGGKGYQDFRSYFFKGTQFYDPLEQVGSGFQRRTLYRMWARGGRSPFLDTFDCPDPSTPTPRRAVTTTPLQALALMNNAQVLDLSDQLAARLKKEVGSDIEKQIMRLHELAYGRTADAEEIALMKPFVEKHGLAALCRVVFNSNEFLTID